ncbi:MAG: hypothetical protein ABFQ64_09395, partial [Campylobacterota bacterium]
EILEFLEEKNLMDLYKKFNNDSQVLVDFIEQSDAFHNKYVHISHTDLRDGKRIYNDFAGSLGMGAEWQGEVNWDLIRGIHWEWSSLHRTYFIPKYEDMHASTKSTEEIRDYIYKYGALMPAAALATYVSTMNGTFELITPKKFQ